MRNDGGRDRQPGGDPSRQPRKNGHRKRLLARAAAASLTVVAVLAAVAFATGRYGDGPVRFTSPDDQRMMSSYVTATGTHAVFGGNVVHNTGDRAATLTAASLVGSVPEKAARVVQVRVLDPRGNDLIGAGPWPFEDYRRLSVPLAGHRLPPGGEVALMYVVAVDRDGRWEWPRARVDYTYGGVRFMDDTASGFMVCAPRRISCHPDIG